MAINPFIDCAGVDTRIGNAITAVMSTGTLISPITLKSLYCLNDIHRLTLPSADQLIDQWARGHLLDDRLTNLLGYLGANGRTIFAAKRLYKSAERKAGFLLPIEFNKLVNQTPLSPWDNRIASATFTPPLELLLNLWNRGYITAELADVLLHRLGIPQAEMRETLKAMRRYLPPVQDIIRFAVREAFAPEPIRQRLGLDEELPPDYLFWAERAGLGQVQGFGRDGFDAKEENFALHYWRSHWQYISPTQAYEALHRIRPGPAFERLKNQLADALKISVAQGAITQAEADKQLAAFRPFTYADLSLLLRASDYPVPYRAVLAAISFRPLGRIDIRRMRRIGVIDKAETRELYLDLGYDTTNADRLAEFTERTEVLGRLTPQQIGRLYARGKITRESAAIRLSARGYTSQDIEDFLVLYPIKITETVKKSRASIEAAYRVGTISTEQALLLFQQHGFTRPESTQLVGQIELDVNLENAREIISQVRKRVLGALISLDDARAMLTQLQLQPARIQRYIDLWTLELSGPRKGITTSTILDAYRTGVITLAEAIIRLDRLGYTIRDRDILLSGATLKQRKDQLDFARETGWEAGLAVRRASPQMLTRWVKRKLLDPQPAYLQLRRAGFTIPDANRMISEALGRFFTGAEPRPLTQVELNIIRAGGTVELPQPIIGESITNGQTTGPAQEES